MALINVAAVVLAYMVLWFVAAGRIIRSEEPQQAAEMYTTALGKAGPAFGVYLLYAFGLRIEHVTGALTALYNVVINLA